jgi:hypothetical protein
MLPIGLTKGAAEEQVKGSLFSIVAAENTVVVIAFKSVFFPS